MKNSLSEIRDSLNKLYSGNLFEAAGKIVVIVFIVVWFIGCSLLVLAMTDLFQESFFNRKYAISYLLMGGATATVIAICVAYYKSKIRSTKADTELL
jgi:hypothetical protein